MVNIQNSIIGHTAFNALATKFFYESKFSFPIPWMFMRRIAIRIPESISALCGTKPMLTYGPALFTCLLALPSCREITRSGAKFPCAVFDAVKMGFERFVAVAAIYCDGALFHIQTISEWRCKSYFDIACRRIEEAYRQPRLFAEPAAKPVQVNMFGGEK